MSNNPGFNTSAAARSANSSSGMLFPSPHELLGIAAEMRTRIIAYAVFSEEPLKPRTSRVIEPQLQPAKPLPLHAGPRSSRPRKKPLPAVTQEEAKEDKFCEMYLQPALAAVNRQLRGEVLSIWYSDNVFGIEVQATKYDQQMTHYQRTVQQSITRPSPQIARVMKQRGLFTFMQQVCLDFEPNAKLLDNICRRKSTCLLEFCRSSARGKARIQITQKRSGPRYFAVSGLIAELCACELYVAVNEYSNPKHLVALAAEVEILVVGELQSLYHEGPELWNRCLKCRRLRSRRAQSNIGNRYGIVMAGIRSHREFWRKKQACGMWDVPLLTSDGKRIGPGEQAQIISSRLLHPTLVNEWVIADILAKDVFGAPNSGPMN